MAFDIKVEVDKEAAILAGCSDFGIKSFSITDSELSELSEQQRYELAEHLKAREAPYGSINIERYFWRNPFTGWEEKLYIKISRMSGLETIKEILDQRIELRDKLNEQANRNHEEVLAGRVDRINSYIEKGVEQCLEQSSTGMSVTVDDVSIYLENCWRQSCFTIKCISEIREFDPECAEEAADFLKDLDQLVKEYNEKEARKVLSKNLQESKETDEEKHKEQVRQFIELVGTESQKDRHAEDFLSPKEIADLARSLVFPREPFIFIDDVNIENTHDPKDNLVHDKSCHDHNHVDFDEYEANHLSEKEFNTFKGIKDFVNAQLKLNHSIFEKDAIEFQPLEITGFCHECEETYTFRYVKLDCRFAGMNISSSYLLDGTTGKFAGK